MCVGGKGKLCVSVWQGKVVVGRVGVVVVEELRHR